MLPARTNPGNRHQYKRVNGPYTLYINAVGGCKLPFGNLPRLLLAWLCSEAVRTQSRVLVLGASLAEFMRKLGMQNDSGSPRGDRTRLRNQMDRLFSATVSLIYQAKQEIQSGHYSFAVDSEAEGVVRESRFPGSMKRVLTTSGGDCNSKTITATRYCAARRAWPVAAITVKKPSENSPIKRARP